MFDSLTGKLETVFKKLRGRGVLKEDDVKEALREVRLALLEADVNFKVVKDFIGRVQERAVGKEILGALRRVSKSSRSSTRNWWRFWAAPRQSFTWRLIRLPLL